MTVALRLPFFRAGDVAGSVGSLHPARIRALRTGRCGIPNPIPMPIRAPTTWSVGRWSEPRRRRSPHSSPRCYGPKPRGVWIPRGCAFFLTSFATPRELMTILRRTAQFGFAGDDENRHEERGETKLARCNVRRVGEDRGRGCSLGV